MRLAFVFFLAVAAACGGALPSRDTYKGFTDPHAAEIVLGVGDLLEIKVWGDGNAGLNTEAAIRPDGTITMPLVGDLKAVGETPSALKAMIRTKLADFVKIQGTEISVAVKEWRSYRFTVQGEVQKTGMYTSPEYVTVSEALALAGGPTRFAKRSQIVLMRKDPKTRQIRRIPLDYETLASGKMPEMNIWVLSGDTIFVP